MTERIALIGTGLMGAPMAARLLGANFAVTVWNRTAAKTTPLAELGAQVAKDAGSALAAADIVISILENGPVTDAVLFASGAVEHLRNGALLIDMASIPPDMARDHAARLQQRQVEYLDAPVSGGTIGAQNGTLTIMVGGLEAAYARAQDVFAPLGRATRIGPHGTGQLAKLANQIIVGVTIGAVAEALLLAAAGGADPAAVREALLGGFADSRILQVHGERMCHREFLPGGRSAIQLKDMNTIVATARAQGAELPISERVQELFQALVDHGGADYDHSALLLELERRNSPLRVGDLPDRLP